jgi:hypothetical protein
MLLWTLGLGLLACADRVDDTDSGTVEGDLQAFAVGLSVDTVVLNQAVDITVVSGGQAIASSDWEAPVIAQRGMLARASVLLGEGFEPGLVTGRLVVAAGGEETVYEVDLEVSDAGDIDLWEGTFQWVLDPIPADATFRIELLEAGSTALRPPDGARYPTRGGHALDPLTDMQLDLVLVPIRCDGQDAPDVSGEDLENFETFLFNTFPVSVLNLTVHDPVLSPGCEETELAHYELPELRDAEGADDWVFYGGLLTNGWGGYTAGGDWDDPAYSRTFASTTWRGHGLTSDLFAHELGHAVGQGHSFEDPNWPVASDSGTYCGTRLFKGYGVRSALMPSSGWGNDLDLGLEWFDPNTAFVPATDPANCNGLGDGNRWNHNDFMGYTYPMYVSAYTYREMAEKLQVINSWRLQRREGTLTTRGIQVLRGPQGVVSSSRPMEPVGPGTEVACIVDGQPVLVRARESASWADRNVPGGLRATPVVAMELALTVPATCTLWGEQITVQP